MDLKCGSVTGSTFMATFDLNHPFMLHFGERRAMRPWTLCVNVRRPAQLLIKPAEQSRQMKAELSPLPPPQTCSHHGNGWKKPSPPRRLFSLSHFLCFCGSLLLWKWCFLLAKCRADLVFSVRQESPAVYYRLRVWHCSHSVHWVSLFFPVKGCSRAVPAFFVEAGERQKEDFIRLKLTRFQLDCVFFQC